MYRSIMVPFIDSRADSGALSAAVQLARRSAARLHVVHVQRDRNRRARVAEEEALNAAVDWAGDEMDESVSFRMITATLPGRRGTLVADSLARYARENDIDFTVMTRLRHSTERVLFGSVGERMLGLIDAPILFVPPRPRRLKLRNCRVLVPLDGTGSAEGILPEAATFAKLTTGSITLLRVLPPPPPPPGGPCLHNLASEDALERETEAQHYLERVAEALRAQGTSVETVTLIGERVASVLGQAAAAEHIDVIALATRPRPSHLAFITESVTARLLSSFDTALLVRQQFTDAVVDSHALAGVA